VTNSDGNSSMVGNVSPTLHTSNIFSAVLDDLQKWLLWGVGGLFPPVAPPLNISNSYLMWKSHRNSGTWSKVILGFLPTFGFTMWTIGKGGSRVLPSRAGRSVFFASSAFWLQWQSIIMRGKKSEPLFQY